MKYVCETSLSATLSEENADEGRLGKLAAKCTMDGPVGSLEKLGREDMVRILDLARWENTKYHIGNNRELSVEC